MKKNSFKPLALTLATALTIGLSACAPATQNGSHATTKDTKPGTTGTMTNASNTEHIIGGSKVELKAMNINDPKIKKLADGLKKNSGYYYMSEDNILLIFLGQRNSGGYSVAVDEAAVSGDTLKVRIKEKAPGPEDMVTAALTYPYVAVQLPGKFKNFDVRDQNGKAYQPSAEAY